MEREDLLDHLDLADDLAIRVGSSFAWPIGAQSLGATQEWESGHPSVRGCSEEAHSEPSSAARERDKSVCELGALTLVE
jgi:hypothetical protein